MGLAAQWGLLRNGLLIVAHRLLELAHMLQPQLRNGALRHGWREAPQLGARAGPGELGLWSWAGIEPKWLQVVDVVVVVVVRT